MNKAAIQIADGFAVVPGQVFPVVHAASFENTHFSQPLTTYSVGWRDPANLRAMRQFLFPDVQVPRFFQFMQADAGKDFVIESDLDRAAGADFTRIEWTGTKQTQKVPNRGLGILVDEDDITDGTDWQRDAVDTLMARIDRAELNAGVGLIQSAAALTAKTWDKDHFPDSDLNTLVDGSGDLIGFNPTRLAFIGGAWNVRTNALYATDTPAASAALQADPDQVAVKAGAQRGMIINARKASGSGKAKIGANNVIAFHAEEGLHRNDASSTKCFWAPCANGQKFRVLLRQVADKAWIVIVEYYSLLAVTSTLGLKGHTVANA